MAQVKINSGVCGFSTTINTETDDGQHITINFDSNCPHVQKAKGELTEVDAFSEIAKKPHETKVYQILSPYLAHNACPVYSGFLKAIEVAAGLALPKDVTMEIKK